MPLRVLIVILILIRLFILVLLQVLGVISMLNVAPTSSTSSEVAFCRLIMSEANPARVGTVTISELQATKHYAQLIGGFRRTRSVSSRVKGLLVTSKGVY